MSVMQQDQIYSNDEVVELNITTLIMMITYNYRSILAGAIIGTLISGIYAFTRPNEFTSRITVLPEVQTKGPSSLNNLGSLAGLAGIDIGNISSNTDAVRPELYPNVIQSVPFALTLFKKPVFISQQNRTEIFETYLAETTKSWFDDLLSFTETKETIVQKPNMVQAIQINKDQESIVKKIHERVNGTYDKKTYVLTVTTTMPDPIVAADIANYALTYLTDYITNYRTEKSRREVNFLNQQVFSAKKRYQAAEYTLAVYRDQNRNTYLNTTKVEEQRIQAEFLLSQDLYNTLSKQAEMAKIKVQEDTPIFKILEPAQIPTTKSSPKRMIIILLGTILGMLCSLVFIYFSKK